MNRHLTEGLELSVDLRSFGAATVLQHTVLEHEDIYAANTRHNPGTVLPHDRGNASAEGDGSALCCPKLPGTLSV
ncbi:Intracellular exo-alpha-(1-_5)-L-arabinofuranosidase 1 [compost metagenome]